MHHRHDNLFLGAVLEAQQEEGVAFMTGGVGSGTHNAHLLYAMMLIVLLTDIHAHVVDELATVAGGNGVGTEMSIHKLFVVAVKQVVIVELCRAAHHLRGVLVGLAATGEEQQGSNDKQQYRMSVFHNSEKSFVKNVPCRTPLPRRWSERGQGS